MNDTHSDRVASAPDGRLSLSGRLTINEAEALRDAWASALAGCGGLAVDTRELEAVDVAGLQMLIALRRSAERTGKAVRLAEPPAGALLAALMAAGFRNDGDAGAPAAGRDEFWWGRS